MNEIITDNHNQNKENEARSIKPPDYRSEIVYITRHAE